VTVRVAGGLAQQETACELRRWRAARTNEGTVEAMSIYRRLRMFRGAVMLLVTLMAIGGVTPPAALAIPGDPDPPGGRVRVRLAAHCNLSALTGRC
jgi:hypothetical protein